MTTTYPALPGDLRVRPATIEDIAPIVAIVVANEIAETGQSETIPEDLRELWADNEMNLASDTYVLITADGRLIGYAGVSVNDEVFFLDPHTSVDPDYQQRGLEHYLLQLVEQRAREHLANVPDHARVITTPSFSSAWTELLKREGYTVTSAELRMEIMLHKAPPAPCALPGITIRQYLPGEEAAIHFVVQEAFRDIGGRPYRPFEEWREGTFQRSGFDPAMLYVAVADETVVGAALCRSYPAQHEGYISQVAVLNGWRRRGIAVNLLYTVFDEFYQRDMPYVMLSVDGHNTTGARELYLHAGMRQKMQIDNMQKEL